jgi:hypothetical protein
MMDAMRRRKPLLGLAFNQDASCLLGGLQGGFLTYNTEPFAEGTRRSFNGGVGIVELLYRSNLVALVGAGSCPQFPVNKVMLWDDSKRKCVGELSFHTAVSAVRMRKDVIVVALERKVFVYNFSDLQLLDSFETAPNARGLVALSLEADGRVLAFPAASSGSRGVVRLERLGGGGGSSSSSSSSSSSNPSSPGSDGLLVEAHESELGALAVSRDGRLLASASERGTLIRVFSAVTGQFLQELRRGADRAIIYSLAFNPAATLLACSSDKGTVHVFTVPEPPAGAPAAPGGAEAVASAGAHGALGAPAPAAAEPPLSSISGILGIASMAQTSVKRALGDYLPKYLTVDARRSAVRIPVQDSHSVCAFGARPNTLLVAGMDGSFLHVVFDPESGVHERTFLGSVYSNEP